MSQLLAGSKRTDQRSQPTDYWLKRLIKRKWKNRKNEKGNVFTREEERHKPRQLFFFHNLFGCAEAVSWLHEVIVSFPRVDGVSMISVAIKVLRTEPQLNGHTLMLTALRSTLVHTLIMKKKVKWKWKACRSQPLQEREKGK